MSSSTNPFSYSAYSEEEVEDEPSMVSRDQHSGNSISSDDEIDDVLVSNYIEISQMISIVGNEIVSSMNSSPQRRLKGKEARRNYVEGHNRLYKDYFAEQPNYNERLFRRRFRMRKSVFLRIVDAVTEGDQWFVQKRNAAGRIGLSPLQKCTAAIRMLAYGVAADQVDEYVRISETTARKSLQKFCVGVIRQFGRQYLRRPNNDDLARLLYIGEERGFPGMIGSIDCMHWEWKNCPVSWKAQFQGREGVATLVLEAVADRDLWIWHTFFGMPGSVNDITVLSRSPVFREVLEGQAPPVNFTVNGNTYNLAYYLTDGIYPKWATFVKSITNPLTPKERLFAQHQEAARKDVERAFGVLQARFAIVRNPALAWNKNAIHRIMLACVIMHNMIVEDERSMYMNYMDINEFVADQPQPSSTNERDERDNSFRYRTNRIVDINKYLENKEAVEDQSTHLRLREDLMENIWQKFHHTVGDE